MNSNIKFEINDAPRDSIDFDLPGDTTILEIKNLIQKKPGYDHLKPEDYMLLIEGNFY